MNRNNELYQRFLNKLKEELIPVSGCTEPIAIAYAAAKARNVLGRTPERVEVFASGNIIKNVQSVTIPNTGGLTGIEAAAAVGVIAGKAERILGVIDDVTEAQKAELRAYLEKDCITVMLAKTDHPLDIEIVLHAGDEHAGVRIADAHSNIVRIEKNGSVLALGDIRCVETAESDGTGLISISDIYEFARDVDISDVEPILKLQIECNTRISREGLKNRYGANIGSVLLSTYGDRDVAVRARAKAAAGSDARMSGCEMPVVINSGSGNQGLTVSLPVIEYAEALHSTSEQLYRALTLSNLIAMHIKAGIGPLSAYCGAVCAGAASGAGIALLQGGDLGIVEKTVVNALAITSGIICDGAKASCAAKIAESVDAGILGCQMAMSGRNFRDREGIVKDDAEATIKNVGILGKDGMRVTDEVILQLMIQKS